MSAAAAPRVAVLVPCFNAGGLLREALGSLEDQEPCEVVVVDDGSSDPETLAALREAEESGVRVIRQANAGPSAARVTALAATRAPLVHPLDADDRLAPGALTLLADALQAAPGAMAAWGDYRTFGALDCRFPCADRLDPWRITYLDEIPGTSMVRREALEAIGGWTLDGGYEDWDLWMSLAERGWDGVHVPEVTLHYREHDAARIHGAAYRRHAERMAVLRARHPALFAARRANRRRSPSPLALRLLFPLIDAAPRLPELRKQHLYAAARKIVQPRMASECFPGVPEMAARLARGLARRARRALSPRRR